MIQKNIIAFGLGLGILIGCTQSQSMELAGRISIKGPAHHSYLSIYDKVSQKNYKIQNKEKFNLGKYQNKEVVIEVKIIKEAIGPGFPAIVQILKLK
jgi:hypothetical protein